MFRTAVCRILGKVGWLGISACATTALAQTPGTFAPTGGMTTSRDEHTATLLTNGKVLIVRRGRLYIRLTCQRLSSYDPSTGSSLSATSALSTARRLHSATLLADGKVLIAGGWTSGQALISAELYDPSTGTFTSTGNMLIGGAGTATLLANGKVLIAHDPVLSKDPVAAELYYPAIGIFAAIGDQRVNPNDSTQAAALLPDGRNPSSLRAAPRCNSMILSVVAFSFTTGTPLLQDFAQNFWFTMTLLTANGKLLLFRWLFFCEGNQGDPVSASAGLYDPSNGASSAAGNMTTPRADHSATLLPDGTVLIAGGLRSTDTPSDFKRHRRAL